MQEYTLSDTFYHATVPGLGHEFDFFSVRVLVCIHEILDWVFELCTDAMDAAKCLNRNYLHVEGFEYCNANSIALKQAEV